MKNESAQKDIVYIKLTDGTELVSYSMDMERATELTNPVIIFSELVEGNLKSSFFPYMPHKEGLAIVLLNSSICSVASPSESLVNQYKKYIGEIVIQTPSKEIILPK